MSGTRLTMRRTLIIVGTVVLLLAIGVGTYFLFFANRGGITGTPGTEFPLGPGENPDGGGQTTPNQELGVPSGGAGTEVAPRLIRITDEPVAFGSVAVYVPPITPVATTSTSTTPVAGSEADVRVEYIERESGNIYAYQAHGRVLTRLTNKTLPGIQEATWLSDGSLAYTRFLSTEGGAERINTYALPADGSDGYFLESSLAQVLTRATSTLVTLLSASDGSVATVAAPSGAGARRLFSSPLSAVRMTVLGNNYMVYTKGSSQANGYVFTVDATNGTFTRALGPLQGLSALGSPTGNYILYSYIDRGKVAVAVLDMSTHVATRLPLATLPEKCVWALDGRSLYCGVPTAMSGTQPDDWYQGASPFTDRIWKVDLASRIATLLVAPEQVASINIDAVSLAVDRTEDILIFTNRRDGLLYAYDL